MIVARITTAAEVVLSEFSKTKIMELLQRAINLSAGRGNMQDHQYSAEANSIRSDAQKIVVSDSILLFPKDMLELLYSSGYSPVLPGNLATVIINGISSNKTASMSSSEFGIYQTAAQELLSELGNLLVAFKKLKFDRIEVPDGKISLDILIPRDTANNDIYYFINVNKCFADIISAFQRLMGLDEENPQLVYSSTTDLVTGLTIAVLAITPFLDFYNKLLDAAKKHLEILQVIKTIKGSPLSLSGEQNLEVQLEETTKKQIQDAVEKALSNANSPVQDPGIASELRNLISIKSKMVVNAISNGTRVGITVESLVSLPTTLDSAGVSYEPLKELIEQNASIGNSVAEGLRSLGEAIPLQIADDTSKK